MASSTIILHGISFVNDVEGHKKIWTAFELQPWFDITTQIYMRLYPVRTKHSIDTLYETFLLSHLKTDQISENLCAFRWIFICIRKKILRCNIEDEKCMKMNNQSSSLEGENSGMNLQDRVRNKKKRNVNVKYSGKWIIDVRMNKFMEAENAEVVIMKTWWKPRAGHNFCRRRD